MAKKNQLVSSIQVYDNYRVALLTTSGKETLGINKGVGFYVAQVFMKYKDDFGNDSSDWFFIQEHDKKTGQNIITLHQSEAICCEYIEYIHDKQLKILANLRKNG